MVRKKEPAILVKLKPNVLATMTMAFIHGAKLKKQDLNILKGKVMLIKESLETSNLESIQLLGSALDGLVVLEIAKLLKQLANSLQAIPSSKQW
ncbi:hypothetical protein L484_022277 [Morus notabilis]|uniref:Uncharacterized protein n=1 Tax=Morus notabilis TaxID=981085 RepID=W9SE63_9ROSA|nr:hypothetical protein L484_022277 [Morus notabilis]